MFEGSNSDDRIDSCPFVLKQKDQKFKADIIGPNAQSGHFPAMSARPARPTHSRFGVPIHGIRTRNSTSTDKAPPFTLKADLPPFKGGARRAGD